MTSFGADNGFHNATTHVLNQGAMSLPAPMRVCNCGGSMDHPGRGVSGPPDATLQTMPEWYFTLGLSLATKPGSRSTLMIDKFKETRLFPHADDAAQRQLWCAAPANPAPKKVLN